MTRRFVLGTISGVLAELCTANDAARGSLAR